MQKQHIYIFDLDDTLYQNDESGTTVANVVRRDVLERLPGTKLVFSNASYGHCITWLNRLGISDIITAVISSDIIGGFKPQKEIYSRIMTICNINLAYCEITFFDNLVCNLIPAHELGWRIVFITPFYSNINDDSQNVFSNINAAIEKYAQN
jgi:hypothetical protein